MTDAATILASKLRSQGTSDTSLVPWPAVAAIYNQFHPDERLDESHIRRIGAEALRKLRLIDMGYDPSVVNKPQFLDMLERRHGLGHHGRDVATDRRAG